FACRSLLNTLGSRSISVGPQLAVARLVSVLQPDQHAFDAAKQYERERRCEYTPQHNVHPYGGTKFELHQERTAEDDESQNEYGKHRRPVARIRKCVTQSATIALLTQHEPR